MRPTSLLVLLPALVSVVLGAFAYLAPGTGVTGTGGALLALIGAAAVAVASLVTLSPSARGGLLGLLNVLIGLGAVLTAVAAWFLMQYPFAAAMALAFAGLLLSLALPDRRPVR